MMTRDNSLGDMEKVLDLAEESQMRVERHSRLIAMMRAMSVMLVVLAIGFVVYLSMIFPRQSPLWIVPAISVAYAVFIELSLTSRLVRRRKRESRALYEIVSLARETIEGVAEREDWPVLRKMEFRIRLSRFDIGL
jgi:hypothetical protein